MQAASSRIWTRVTDQISQVYALIKCIIQIMLIIFPPRQAYIFCEYKPCDTIVAYSYMNMWNIHTRRTFVCRVFPKYAKHWRLSVLQVRNFCYLLDFKVFRHAERETQSLLSWLFHLTPTPRGASRRPNWTRLGSDLNSLCPASNLK